MGTRPVRELHVRIEHLEAPPKVRKRRFEFPLVEQRRADQIIEVEVIAEHRSRGRADDDLVRLRQCLQTRRQARCERGSSGSPPRCDPCRPPPAKRVFGWQPEDAAPQHLAKLEAIDQFRRGLALVEALSDARERAARELDLQMALGPALVATKTQIHPDIGRAYARAWELCQKLGDHPREFTAACISTIRISSSWKSLSALPVSSGRHHGTSSLRRPRPCSRDIEVAIGAGFSGMYMLKALRDRLGLKVRVYEAGETVGGTWYWNRRRRRRRCW